MEEQEQIPQEKEQEHYKPRPRWQLAAAWLGVALMVLGVIAYYITIAKGGL